MHKEENVRRGKGLLTDEPHDQAYASNNGQFKDLCDLDLQKLVSKTSLVSLKEEAIRNPILEKIYVTELNIL